MIGRSFALALLFFVCACKSDEEKAREESARKLEEASKKMQEAAKSGQVNIGDAMAALGAAVEATNAGKNVEPVDFRDLRAMLPGSVGGLKRKETTGARNSAMGMQISTASADYSNGDGYAKVTITDIGSLRGLAGLAMYAWASTEFDRETETGYEKTTRFNGNKALEKYDRSTRSGDFSVIVGDRFVVAIEGRGVDMDALRDAARDVNLGKLARMK